MDDRLEPKSVHAFYQPEGTLVDVNTAISVEFTNGAVGNHSIHPCRPNGGREFTFYGTEGVMRIGASGAAVRHRKGEDIRLPQTPGRGKPPADNFIEAIQGEADVQAPPICGLRVVQLTEAAYKSAASGKPETVS